MVKRKEQASVGSRLAGALGWASVLALADSLAVRHVHHHREPSLWLFAETLALWLAFALASLPWTLLVDRALRGLLTLRKFDRPLHASARHMLWTALPVALHAHLDRYTGLGGNLDGLKHATPWLLAVGILLGCVAAIAVLLPLLERVSGRGLWLACALVPWPVAWFVTFHSGGPSPTGSARADAPNVLLLVWDTTRADALTPYGYDRDTTPHLARFAEQSLRFSNSRSVSTYTLTSHLSMLTGVYPSHHGARLTRQFFRPWATPTVVREFREAGYRTAAFVGTDVLRAQSGIDYAFETYDDRVDPWVTYTQAWAIVHDAQSLLARLAPGLASNGEPHWIQDFQRPASEVLANALEWIEADDPRPWFCFVNLYDVHWPYLPGPEARERFVRPYEGPVDGYALRGDRVRSEGLRLDGEDARHVRDLYDAELWSLDREVDRFLARLDLGRTAVVLTSDHGEAFGEHGQYEHKDVLECHTRVPLLVRPAGSEDGREVREPVHGIDVAPTLLALAGLAPSTEQLGVNLLGPIGSERILLVENRDNVDPSLVKLALYAGDWKLVQEVGRDRTPRWRLYDVAQDPAESQDRATDRPEVVERLRAELEALRARWGADDERDGRVQRVDNPDALDALGYGGD